VKDSIATAGLRTTAGSRLLADCVPVESAPAVRRLQEAGAVLLGKTNTPPFALDLHTDNELFGPTLNPRDITLTPGGSSGGESAALAAGCSALGVGTDFGASLRWPAQCTGVVSLRPTVGRVPSTGALPYFTAKGLVPPGPHSFFAQTQVIGPLARSVRDLALALNVMSGPDGLDLTTRSAGPIDPDSVDVAMLGCAWFDTDGSYPASAEIARTVSHAAEALAAVGVTVVNTRPNAITKAESIYDRLRTADNATWMSLLPMEQDGRRPPAIQAAIDGSAQVSDASYQAALIERDALRYELSIFMQQYPILLAPVSLIPAFPAAETEHAVEGRPIPRMAVVTPCRAIGLYGLPSASVPFGLSADGATISVQVVGRPFAEHQVLAVAGVLERHFGTD
jgi:Asp-tRNA(Asn)/Glu-tRNA(Gln) amidotransferase A subunit family amidase